MKKSISNYRPLELVTTDFIYIIATFFLLYCGTEGYVGISESKFNAFCVICGGYIGITLLLMIELLLIGEIKLKSLIHMFKEMHLSQKLALLYLILTWISAFLSPYFPETIIGSGRYEGAATISMYCLSFILVAFFGKVTKGMIYLISLVALVFSSICILQFQGLNPFLLYPAGYNYYDAFVAYSGQFLGTIGNTGTVAAFLCITIPILWISILRLSDKKRYFLVIPLLLLLYVLIKMWVLAGLVGVTLGGLISLPVVLPLKRNTKKILMVSMIIFFVLFLIATYFVNFDSGLFHEIREILHGNIDEGFGSGRIHIWSAVLKEVPNNLFFGMGPDTMIKADIQPFIRYDNQIGGAIVGKIDAAHNEYLNILFHQGILALTVYLLMIISWLKMWFKESFNNKTIAILGGAILCYLIQAFFGIGSCIASPFFWIIAGLMIKYKNSKEDII